MIGPSRLPYTTSPRLRNGVTSVSRSAPSLGGRAVSSGNVVPSIMSPTAVTTISSCELGGCTALSVVGGCTAGEGDGCGMGVGDDCEAGPAELVVGFSS